MCLLMDIYYNTFRYSSHSRMDPVGLILLLILLALPAFAIVKSYSKKKKIAFYVNQLPGPKTYPIFGTSLAILRSPRKGKYLNFTTLTVLTLKCFQTSLRCQENELESSLLSLDPGLGDSQWYIS